MNESVRVELTLQTGEVLNISTNNFEKLDERLKFRDAEAFVSDDETGRVIFALAVMHYRKK